MTIREKGYHRWEGQLDETGARWLPIFLNGIKSVWKKKWSKVFFALSISPFLIFLIGIYVSTRPELRMLPEVVKLITDDAVFFNAFMTNGFAIFMLVMLAIFFGVDLISGDKKFNSFPLYFSRPLDRKDYIIGKFSVIMFYYLLFTLVPGILLYIFKMILIGKVSLTPNVLLGLTFVPILTSFFLASITLMVSSISGNTRYVRIVIFIIYFISRPIAALFIEIFDKPIFHVISVHEVIEQMGTFIFNAKPAYRYPGWISVAVILVISLGSFLILYSRIGKAEAQIETGN